MHYEISGLVIKGDGYGKVLGFPTVNLDIGKEVLPPQGVYAGFAVLEGKEYRAGIVIGPGVKVEAHLLDFSGDAYGKEVKLEARRFLREYKKFDTEEELKKQIENDLQSC